MDMLVKFIKKHHYIIFTWSIKILVSYINTYYKVFRVSFFKRYTSIFWKVLHLRYKYWRIILLWLSLLSICRV
jgi:hypothetical protein